MITLEKFGKSSYKFEIDKLKEWPTSITVKDIIKCDEYYNDYFAEMRIRNLFIYNDFCYFFENAETGVVYNWNTYLDECFVVNIIDDKIFYDLITSLN